MNNLAGVLRRQGKYEQAEEMHRQGLRLGETVLGKEHSSTLTSMHNLATVLSDHGNLCLACPSVIKVSRLARRAASS
jgi:hypothetical protein